MQGSIGCFVSTLLIFGCTNRTPQQRLAAFVNDPENKIVQSIQVGDVKAIAKWLPAQYRNGQFTIDKDNPQSKSNDNSSHEDYCYFNVRFERTAIEKPANEKLLYLNFDMQNDFLLFCAGDSLSAAICQKIESGITGRYEYMIAFQDSNEQLRRNDFTLYFKDKIFGVGVIAFVFSQKDIQRVPRI